MIVAALQTSRFTPNGCVRTSYGSGEIDFVAVYCGDLDRCYLLPESVFVDRRGIHLRLNPTRNGQRASINLAAEYEFAGAVAQLARASGWQPEGRGFESLQLHSPTADETVVGAHEFRNRFGWYAERAASGEQILVTFRGRPHLRLAAA